ncbi:GntR family transcriptional regulator [Falsiroseomonas sp. CW058]|uniref:GntR family transcriptional regulator n=1 Tax=Falsiroseomonas sp. CW058 TaxID=3388664 RepID=UPI003D323DA3
MERKTPATTSPHEGAPAEPDGHPAASAAHILQVLRRRIVQGDIAPGVPLVEMSLAAEFATSRAKIREVLAMLDERGLVERRPNRGAVVRRATLGELRHLFEVREALEGMAARLAAQNAAPGSWRKLVELFGAPTEALVEAGDATGYVARHERLRTRILEEARNPVLTATLAPLYDRTAAVMRRLVLVTNRPREALAEHRAVLAALAARDPDAAEACKRAQLRSARLALEHYSAFVL